MARGRNYLQGKYEPIYKNKYIGDVNNIVFRSSWEMAFMKYCDTSEHIHKYASEEVIIPYICGTDNRRHRYFVDFYVIVRTKTGFKKILIEIKPHKETQRPKRGKTENDASFQHRVLTYVKNQSKWNAAREWCKAQNCEFMILTEKHLFPQIPRLNIKKS